MFGTCGSGLDESGEIGGVCGSGNSDNLVQESIERTLMQKASGQGLILMSSRTETTAVYN